MSAILRIITIMPGIRKLGMIVNAPPIRFNKCFFRFILRHPVVQPSIVTAKIAIREIPVISAFCIILRMLPDYLLFGMESYSISLRINDYGNRTEIHYGFRFTDRSSRFFYPV